MLSLELLLIKGVLIAFGSAPVANSTPFSIANYIIVAITWMRRVVFVAVYSEGSVSLRELVESLKEAFVTTFGCSRTAEIPSKTICRIRRFACGQSSPDGCENPGKMDYGAKSFPNRTAVKFIAR